MILGIVCVMLMVIPSIVVAQTQAGQREVTIMGLLNKTEVGGEDVEMTMIGGGYGYFVSDVTEIGVNGMLTRLDYGDEAYNILFLDPFIKYHFPTEGTIVPYVGAHVGLMTISNGVDDSAHTYGVYGGMKNFLTENIAIFVQLDLSKYKIDDEEADQTQITAGYSYTF